MRYVCSSRLEKEVANWSAFSWRCSGDAQTCSATCSGFHLRSAADN